MTTDNYGEIINGQETYDRITAYLLLGKPVIIGWTDEQMSHFDIMFTYGVAREGTQIQGGINPPRDLFVSIMRVGAFAFEVSDEDTHPMYYAEKLGFTRVAGSSSGASVGITLDKLAELINGVRTSLFKTQK